MILIMGTSKKVPQTLGNLICSFAGAYSKDYIMFRVCLARGKNRNERKGLGFSVKGQVYWDFLGFRV